MPTYTLETRLALANLDDLAGERVLLVGADVRDLPRALTARGSTVHLFHPHLWSYRASAPDAPDAYTAAFGSWIDEAGPYDRVVVMLPKETERLRLLVAMGRSVIAPGGDLVVIGHNKAGIRGAGRTLTQAVGAPEVLDTRHHCRAWRVRSLQPAPASLEQWRSEHELDTPGGRLRVVSYPGLFAHGRLDEGTRLLLEQLEPRNGARCLDVGSGSGVIAAWLGRGGASVTGVDGDALAVLATKQTFELNGLDGRVEASDVLDDVEGRFDLVVSNPPFHAGVRTTHAVAHRLIDRAPRRLEAGGELWLVANRFLDYLTPLTASFATVEVTAETNRFRVYRAQRRPGS